MSLAAERDGPSAMTTPGQYAQELSQRASGPHDDQATAQVAELPKLSATCAMPPRTAA